MQTSLPSRQPVYMVFIETAFLVRVEDNGTVAGSSIRIHEFPLSLHHEKPHQIPGNVSGPSFKNL